MPRRRVVSSVGRGREGAHGEGRHAGDLDACRGERRAGCGHLVETGDVLDDGHLRRE